MAERRESVSRDSESCRSAARPERRARRRRRTLGLSQTEVAARMGTSQSAVARIENRRL